MGILKASEIIAEVLLQSGLLVRQSEVHGMAQRGGSVVTHLRYGEEVYAPLLTRGEADFMLAFEEMEALRYLSYLKKQGTIVLNVLRLYPPGIVKNEYPEQIPELLRSKGYRVFSIPATGIAQHLGDMRTTNLVLLGALSRIFPIGDEGIWREAIDKALRGKALELNLKAFAEGRNQI